jgi:regulator of sirC expression with transglutaminase-like and TPR domain
VSPDQGATGRFAALGRAREGAVRLAEAALWIAATEYTDLDVPAWLGRLDALGAAAARAVAPEAGAGEAAAALGRLLFEREGFRGNAEEYYDPRNSFLNDVLERRVGIPITLSVVYLDVATAAGVTAHGVGLPGHFVVRVERAGDARLVDPFHGGTPLDESDCHALVEQVLGRQVPFDPAWLRPVTTVEIVARMLANLKGVYVGTRDWPRALRTAECLVALRPGALGEVRDRGTVHARLGDPRAAIRDWESYLTGAPEASDAAEVRRQLRAARQSLAVLN